jgi:RNA polymerase sigma-70 factor (ECF subfamily)
VARRSPPRLQLADGEHDVFGLVYRQMRSLTGRSQDLDDLVQTALEQVQRSQEGFEGRSKWSTWTYGVCYRVWLKHQRWHRRWARRFVLTRDSEQLDEPDPELSAAERLEQRERARRLRAALERVTPKRRAVVVLHDLEGLSIEEVASAVRANPLTVRSRLRDGRRVLSELLHHDPYFGGAAVGAARASGRVAR